MKIKEMPHEDRPREKMMISGAQSLTNAELLTILIHSGTKESPAIDVARQLLNLSNNNLMQLGKLTHKDITKQLKGIGPAKACSILAALELGRRYHSSSMVQLERINSSKDAYHLLFPHMPLHDQEEFHALYLNQNNKVILHKKISSGGVSETSADIRLILREAITHTASALIVCHNHPSGSSTPSKADDQVTSKLKAAAALHDIRLLDHLIIAHDHYFSYADEGKL